MDLIARETGEGAIARVCRRHSYGFLVDGFARPARVASESQAEAVAIFESEAEAELNSRAGNRTV